MPNSEIIFQHLLFFLVGVFQDVLITFYYQAIAKENAVRSGFFSTTVTLINLVILYKILTGIEDQVLSIIFVYAIGNGVGTMLVLKKQQLKTFIHTKYALLARRATIERK